MVKKLFGETEDEQFRYLKPKILALGVALAVTLIGSLLGLIGIKKAAEILCALGGLIFVIDLFIFGWAIMKGLFGVASQGNKLYHNVVVGVGIFIFYIMVGYFGGLVAAVIGLCRFLMLLKHRRK